MVQLSRLASLIFLTTALTLSGSAWAGMALDRSIIHMNAGDAESVDVTVSNNGDEPLYVDTDIMEVFNPGMPGEDRVPLGVSLDMPMLVSPNKLVIPPGERRLLRIMNMAGHAEQERVFRVTAKPVAPPAVAERSGIRVLVGYQMLVIVGPREPKPDLQSRREGGKLTVENRGNVNFMLHSGVQCPVGIDPEENAEGCTNFSGTRLYPGNAMTFEVPYESPVLFTVTDGEKNSRRSF